MDHTNLTLVLQSPLQSSANSQIALIASALLGAVLTGAVQLLINRNKNKNLQIMKKLRSYSQLMGQTKMITQLYQSVFTYQIKICYNKGLIRFIEKTSDVTNGPVFQKIEEIENLNQTICVNHDEIVHELAKVDQNFWETIGLIQSLFSHKKFKEELDNLIKNIEASQGSLENFQNILDDQVKDTLPNPYFKNLAGGVKKIESTWQDDKEKELTKLIMDFNNKIKDLMRYIYEKNKDISEIPWWQFWK
jgi:hypothetical protein